MSSRAIIKLKVQSSADVVLVRQRAQAIAELAKFDTIKQTSFATALSEIARNSLQFASSAFVEFVVVTEGVSNYLTAVVTDNGPGIAEIRARGGQWDRSVVFDGHGIRSARKLVKQFSIECPAAGGTVVKLGIAFPARSNVTPESIASWCAGLMLQKPRNLLEEMHHRNQELVLTLDELRVAEEGNCARSANRRGRATQSGAGRKQRIAGSAREGTDRVVDGRERGVAGVQLYGVA
jgi:anti-sigma regulatory factor (Ser/Thr protein kinase)